MGSKKPSRELRHRVGESQNWRCAYCGVRTVEGLKDPRFFTLDHVKPKSAGGRYSYDNCVGACYQCNHLRGSSEPFSFFESMQILSRQAGDLRRLLKQHPNMPNPHHSKNKPLRRLYTMEDARQWDEDRFAK